MLARHSKILYCALAPSRSASTSTSHTVRSADHHLVDASPRNDNIHIRLVPHVTYTSQCYVFDVIERTLQHGDVLKFGRYNNDRQPYSSRLSFRSKVVSRSHAELWAEDGKLYIRDAGSSSGTFVNRMRLQYESTPSDSFRELFDGDIVQLGVDYQSGAESIYRAVRMRVQISHLCHEDKKASSFSKSTFKQLCSRAKSNAYPKDRQDVQECSICLYAIAPSQALFVAPCSHIYHYKCIRPLLEQNFPAFSCPLCRTYSDLNATVEVDADEVLEVSDEPQISSLTSYDNGASSPSKAAVTGSPLSIKQVLSSSVSGLRAIMT